MTSEEEIANLVEKAKQAKSAKPKTVFYLPVILQLKSNGLTYREIMEWLKKETGHEYTYQSIGNLLHKHGQCRYKKSTT